MPFFPRLTKATTFAAMMLSTALTAAHAAPLSDAQTTAVKELVRETLIKNPAIIQEAMEALKAKRLAEMQAAQKDLIIANADALFKADDPHFGAEKGKYYVAEFFDYNCGYCRHAFADVLSVAKSEKDTKIIIKELPILGPESMKVSRLALASREQGKYNAYHTALMQSQSHLTEDAALTIAKDLGIDVKKLKKDAESKRVEDTITRNRMLAGMLGIRGTPSFIVGDTLIPGKVDATVLKNALNDLRKSKK